MSDRALHTCPGGPFPDTEPWGGALQPHVSFKESSIPESRQQLLCGLYLSSCNSSEFINKMLFLDCQVPVTSTRQAVISVACESSLIMEILLPDSYFCQLYSTRTCGCTQRELPDTMAREMISSLWSTAPVDITWEGCSSGQNKVVLFTFAFPERCSYLPDPVWGRFSLFLPLPSHSCLLPAPRPY